MDFLLEFIRILLKVLFYLSPVILTLGLFISLIGLSIGRKEGWSRIDSLYYAWITATTVGYGDLHPSQSRSKLLAILIAFTGLLLTGVIVAAGVEATRVAFDKTHDTEEILEQIDIHQ